MLLCGAPARAQVLSDERLWVNVTAQERAGTESPWRWYLETQGRSRDGVSGLDMVLVRPAVAYDLTGRFSVWAGYGFTPLYPPTGGALNENRTWQQLLWSGPAGGVTLQLRTRLEQRWMEGGGAVSWRTRQFARVTRQLTARGLAITAWDEVMININDTNRVAQGFDRNRVFGGVAFTVAPHTRFEIGYINELIHPATGPNRRNHVLGSVVNATF